MTQLRGPVDPAPIAAYTEELFGHLPRADQRRWAQSYLQGLLTTPGKKSVRRLAAAVSTSPTASQSLQQFINASPWEWDPARGELMRWVEERAPVRAWTIAPAVLPKRGDHSVGVHRRFVPSAGRTVNCQVALGLFLSVPGHNVPVDWRLFLPDHWADDTGLRRRTRIPDTVRHRPLWADTLDLTASAAARTSLAAVPVVADMTELPSVAPLVSGLSQRGYDFLVAVPDAMQVIADGHLKAQPAAHAATAATTLSARSFLAMNSRRHPHTATVTASDGQQRLLRIVSGLVRVPGVRTGAGAPHRTYRLFAEWQADEQRPSVVWLTSMVQARMSDLLALTRLRAGSTATVHSLREHLGLLDFEGRSYPGWHHHMTLVSAAYAYSRLAGVTQRSEALGLSRRTA
ncbi:transposase [Streptomyces sp. NPDC003036]|uniref:IS701 family transposase n=1 Tax=Streptomyces sp. NPDC003036 TaxID=3154442 RepID=UPI0033B76363